MKEVQNRQEVDYLILLRKIWQQKVIILLVGIVFALGMIAHNRLILKPMYSSKTKIYTVNQSQDQQAVTYRDLQVGINLVKDYEQIIRSKDVMESVIGQLELSMPASYLIEKIKVSSPKDTRVIEIRIEDTDPKRAALLANTIRDVSIDKIKEITKVNDLTVIEYATPARYPFTPNVKKNAVVAFMMGVVFAIGLVVVRELMDECVKREEDVEEGLGLILLGSIPLVGQSRSKRK